MREKKLQVFISSTYTDLREERQAAVEAVLSSGHIPAGMELFAAGDESQMTVIKRWIDESDVYLLILGGRYGSINKKTGKSYIQLEYEYALETKKPLFALIISDSALEEKIKAKGSPIIEKENPNLLKSFRDVLLDNLVKFWEDKKDIKLAIYETLAEFSFRQELIGWIRSNNLINIGILAEEVARLTQENSELKKQISVSPNSLALYSGLTYNELEGSLKRELISHENKTISLFDYVLSNGQQLSTGIIMSDISDDIVEKLQMLKLIRVGPTKDGWRGYKFTDDGHNFFLKARLIDENSST